MHRNAKTSGRVLALVPVSIALVLSLLILPRRVAPRDVPLPRVDAAALERTHAEDAARARAATERPLPIEVRALGAAIRALNTAEHTNAPDTPWDLLRADVDRTRKEALPFGVGPLLDLRAVQAERFLTELRAWEKGAEPSAELAATGGAFLERFAQAGWIDGRHVIPPDDALRVAYKVVWNTVVGLDGVAGFEPTLDEERVLYAFFLSHPHAPERTKASLGAARATAKTAEDCAALDEGEGLAEESWRAEKIRLLGRIDPEYPTDYALGVALYRAGRYEESARSFQAWIDKHPDGELTLRARNHLRAALVEPQ
jgi:hypothetical protein